MPTLDLFPIIKDKPIGQLDTEDFETTAYLSEYNKEDIELIRNLWAIRVNILLEEIESYGITFNSFEEIMEKPNYSWHNFTKYDMGLMDGEATNESALYRNETLIEGIAYHRGCFLGDFVVPQYILAYLKQEYLDGFLPDTAVGCNKERLDTAKNVAEYIANNIAPDICPQLKSQAIIMLVAAMHVEGGLHHWEAYMNGKNEPNIFGMVNKTEYNGNGSEFATVATTPSGKIKASHATAGESIFGLTGWPSKLKYVKWINKKFGYSLPEYVTSDPGSGYNAAVKGRGISATITMPQHVALLIYFVTNNNQFNNIISDDPGKSIIGCYLFKAGPYHDSDWENVKRVIEGKKNWFRANGYKTIPNNFAKQVAFAIMLAQWINGKTDVNTLQWPWKQ